MVALAYIHVDTWGDYLVEFRIGEFSPAVAQSLAAGSCSGSCDHVPLQWSPPVYVATYGLAPIQRVSLATGEGDGFTDAIAVGANGSTEVFVSAEQGAAGSWYSLTGSTPIFGSDPKIVLDSCAIDVTTLNPNGAMLTMLTVKGSCGAPPEMPFINPDAPTVTNVVPQRAAAGASVVVNGTGIGSASAVYFGSSSATFSIINATALRATVPAGAGWVNVTVHTAQGYGSPTVCDDEFLYGATLASGTPQVEGLSVSGGSAGTPVAIHGINVGNAVGVVFGSESAGFVRDFTTELTATAPSGNQGTVSVSVANSRGSSISPTCATQFAYPPLPPTVSSVTEEQSLPGLPVVVNGTDLSNVQEVLFGGTPAVFYPGSSGSLTAVVPPGSGTVNVTVWNPAAQSPQNCSDQFTYGPPVSPALPQVEWIAPDPASAGSTVTIKGPNIGSAAAVTFGSTAASFGRLSSTEIQARVPSGAGALSVRITSSVGTSLSTCASTFQYSTEPTISQLNPGLQVSGQPIDVTGRQFASNASVYFGGLPAAHVQYVSSTLLTATVPDGSGTVPVRVVETAGQSPQVCADLFTYGPTSGPTVGSVSPLEGYSSTGLVVAGANLAVAGTTTEAFVGGIPVTPLGAGPSQLEIQVPQGMGILQVRDSGYLGVSPLSCGAEFDDLGPTLPPGFGSGSVLRTTVTLPILTDAIPVLANTTYPVVVASTTGSNPKLTLYEFGMVSGRMTTTSTRSIFSINESRGSSIFGSIGETRVNSGWSDPGKVAATYSGSALFVAVTTGVEGRTAVATLVSTPSGSNWTGPYLSAATEGSATDPALSISPAGYVFETWLAGGPSGWTVELAVYGGSGSLLRDPEPLPGASDTLPGSPSPPALTIDSLMRPIVAWSTPAGTGAALDQIDYTGGFASPSTETSALWWAFNSTVPADYENFGQPGLSQFQQRVTSLFDSMGSDLQGGDLCTMRAAAYSLYGNVTRLDPSPIVEGPAINGCHAQNGPDNSILANVSAAMVPNFYLSVEAEALLESVGAGSLPLPAWGTIGSNLPPPVFTPGTTGTASDSSGDSVSTTPWTVSPNAMWLNSTGQFVGRVAAHPFTYHGSACGSWTISDQPSRYIVTVSIDHGAGSAPFTSNVSVPSVFVTNLTAMQQGTWSEQVTVDFTTTNQSSNFCSSSDGFKNGTFSAAPPSGWPSTVQLTPSGTFVTGLDPYPVSMTMASRLGQAAGTMNDTLNWSNTMNAEADLWLNASCSPSCDVHWSNSSYQLAERAGGQGLQQVKGGVTYQMTFRIQSGTGLGNWSWTPIDSAGQVSVAAPPESVQFSCTLSQSSSASRTWLDPTKEANNVTGTSALISWYSGQTGTGWVTYSTPGGTVGYQAAQVTTLQNGSAEYFAELHGLEPFSDYLVVGHVEVESGCSGGGQGLSISVQYLGQTSSFQFQTLSQVPIEEQDLPYDSITKQGGGATVFWRVPDSFGNSSTFDNGTLRYYPQENRSATVSIPLSPPLTPLLDAAGKGARGSSLNTTFGVNLTALTANTTYVVNLTLNYTLSNGHAIVVTGEPFNFTYLKDTSGDGLTDWEKLYGWPVTYDGLDSDGVWGWHTENVTASPSLYATNGLVSDYVEKEYGLNPTTLDTAGSHMLDTWNLTFDLGSSSACPSEFQCWYENASNPFSYAQTPGGSPPPGNAPLSTNSTSSAHWSSGGLQDDRPYDAEVLWKGGALGVLQNLIAAENVGWLRGVVMKYGSDWTLTVWGKLSWGANPLAASTPNDGILDGERVNPLYGVGLVFGPVYANTTGLSSGTGVAIKMFYGYNDMGWYDVPTTFRSLSNYSSEGIVGQSPSWIDGYTATLPATQSYQTQTIHLEVVANESGGVLTPLPLDQGQTEVNLTYDLMGGGTVAFNVAGSGSSSASLVGTVHEVPIGVKDPTWLWVPTDNSTINGLPIGLARYTGEQSFDLVTVNDSAASAVSSDPIPLPWGGHAATITLSPGLNAFLIPRQQFLDSPFGQAILLGKSTSYNASNGAPPLIGSSEQGDLTSFGGSNLMVDLGAYWQNRAIADNSGTLVLSSETGTPAGNSLEVQVMAATSASGSNTGGLASTPALYSSSNPAPPALQSIVTLNVSSTDTLDLLLAALIDNTTGGPNAVNGTFQSVTYQLGFLGLDGPVINAIPNATEPGDGLYGPPASHFPPPPQPSGWGAFWNAVTSFVTNPLGTVLSLVSTVWNAATAAFTYLNHLAHEAVAIGAQIAQRAAGALVSIGKIIVSALNALLDYIISLVKATLAPVIDPIVNAAQAYISSVEQAGGTAVADYSQHGAVSARNATAFWNALGGTVFLLALGVSIAVSVALTLLTAVTLGGSFLLGILIALIVSFAVPALPGGLGLSGFHVSGVFGSGAITALETAWQSTSSAIGTFTSAWNAMADIAGLSLTGSSSIGAFLAVAWDSATTGPGPIGTGFAMIFGVISTFIGLIVFGGGYEDSSGGQTVLVSSGILGAFGAILGVLDIPKASNTLFRNTALVAVGLGVAGGAITSTAASK